MKKLHMPIDIDTCTYTQKHGISKGCISINYAHKGNFVVIYQAGKQNDYYSIYCLISRFYVRIYSL